MKYFLGIVVCENYVEEVKCIVKESNLENVIISSFTSQCRGNNMQGRTVIQAIASCEEKCSKIMIMGGVCCTNLDSFAEKGKYKILSFEYCFQILASKDLIEYYINEKSYIVSPGWLKNWSRNIEIMGFNRESAQIFFKDFTSKIVLLNTGIYEDSLSMLQELADFLKMPYDCLPIGQDFTTLLIKNNILELMLEINKKEKIDKLAKNNSKFADEAMISELLSELTQIMSEEEVIRSTVNLFNLFYGPEYTEYITANSDEFNAGYSELGNFDEECIWDDARNGFVLKIAYKKEVLGVIKVYEVTFPDKKCYYMNLAIIIGRVCGLAISNSRKYEKQKITERLLYKEKEKVLYILNSMHEAVCIVNSEYKIIYSNYASGILMKVDKEASELDKSMFNFIHPDYHEIALRRFKKVLQDKTTVPLIQEKFVKPNGEIVEVEVSSGALEYDGICCVLVVARDISERKRAESLSQEVVSKSKLLNDAMEYDKLKNEFFANLSHELRTPLNVLFSTLQLLNLIGKNTYDNDKRVEKYFNIMKQNCYRLLRLINNLIDITKIDAGFYKLNYKNENIVSIIEDITLSVIDYADNKGIEVIFDTEVEEKIIACDADKIERIVLNLLSNAIKFTPCGGKILINIKDNDTSIIVSVKDTGIGIPADMQKTIFDRFVQVDKSLSRNKEGSGIGLSIVKSLVELHGGAIWVESENYEGTEFLFELPVQVLEEPEYDICSNNIAKQDKVQIINIEFSDIYD